jgi:hypothetical protein
VTSYELLKFLHLLAVVVGIGNTAMNPVYGTFAKNRPGPGGLAVTEANYKAAKVGEWFIYAIPIFGILLVLHDDGPGEWGDTWVWLSILLYVIALGIAHGVLFRSHKRMIVLQQELESMGPPPAGVADTATGPPPQVAELDRLGNRLAQFGGLLHVIATVLILLMVWKPGD